MTPDSFISKRLMGLFLLGFVLFNYPIISLFNLDVFWFGIPALYLYAFAAWFLLIVLVVIITKFNTKNVHLPRSASKPE